MFFTIYKTTNLLNNKFYIGKHQTERPFDGYLGSGRLLEAAIKKYGRENFSKEILFIFNSEEEMNFKESELVTKDLVNDDMSYNIGVGGEGGPHFSGRNHTDETKKRLSEIAYEKGSHVSEDTRRKLSENNWARKDPEAQVKHAKAASAKAKRNPAKISASMKDFYSRNPIPRVKCPHCNTDVAVNAMNRYHFDNCKKSQ